MQTSKFENLSPNIFITNHLVRSTKNEARPLVCIKHNDPYQGNWTPIPLTEDTLLPENANLYICISSCNKLFDPTSKFHGTYRASLECASQTHMFMLDDIKTLADLPLEPTWIIETSPENYQCLYVLREPLDDIPFANAITKALPAKANADQSSKNCVRWARLPGGRNNKPEHLDVDGKGFPVQIHTANPELLYSVAHITTAFNLSELLHNSISAPAQSTKNAPIIGVAPSGWSRYLSALLAIPADCDYETWFGAMVAMHPWGEQGYIAFEEWSRTSTNPIHQKLTDEELITKWSSIQYDSSNTKGKDSVIGWPWLQRKALDNGWDYDAYSAEQVKELKNKLQNIETLEDITDYKELIRDAYLVASDLEKIVYIIQANIQLNGQKVTLTAIRNVLLSEIQYDAKDKRWSFPLTDKGNIQRLKKLYDNQLYHVPELKEFIVWENNRWVYKSAILSEIFEAIDQIPYMEKRTVTADEEKQLEKWRHTCENITRIRAMSTMAKEYEPLNKSIKDLNTHNTIIGTPSSILNLETGIPAENTPDHLITMHTNVDVIPDATCPRWNQFLLEIMDGRQDLADFLRRLSGYCLHGGNPEQLFIILEGHGANGKTTFINVLQHVLGNYAATAAADTLTRPAFNKSGSAAAPDIVRLYRKRLVICNEWNEGTYINESLVKVLSGGGDEIAVRALYSNRIISYSPEFIIMLATNHRPNISGMDYGIWRRLLIIPFDVNFTDAQHIEQRDPHLEKYLKENESAGIFNWLIQGYREWQEQGIGTSVETGIPQVLMDMKQQYKLDMDTVGQFLQERTVNTRDNDESECADYRTKSSDLHTAYRLWAQDNGYKPKGSKTFSQTLIHGGFKSIRIGTVRGFEGIRLLTPSEIMTDDLRAM